MSAETSAHVSRSHRRSFEVLASTGVAGLSSGPSETDPVPSRTSVPSLSGIMVYKKLYGRRNKALMERPLTTDSPTIIKANPWIGHVTTQHACRSFEIVREHNRMHVCRPHQMRGGRSTDLGRATSQKCILHLFAFGRRSRKVRIAVLACHGLAVVCVTLKKILIFATLPHFRV